jgi:hypothetical protein
LKNITKYSTVPGILIGDFCLGPEDRKSTEPSLKPGRFHFPQREAGGSDKEAVEIIRIPAIENIGQDVCLRGQSKFTVARFDLGWERNDGHEGSIACLKKKRSERSGLWYNPAASERRHILPGTGIKRP